MAVVRPTRSHSPMASIEHPSAPRTPPPPAPGASEVHDDNRGQPSAGGSSRAFIDFSSSPLKASIARPTNRQDIAEHDVVKDTSICHDFLTQHLRAPPTPFTLTNGMRKFIDQLRKAGTWEPKMYSPAASLLTAISEATYRMFLIFIEIVASLHSSPINRASGRRHEGRSSRPISSSGH